MMVRCGLLFFICNNENIVNILFLVFRFHRFLDVNPLDVTRGVKGWVFQLDYPMLFTAFDILLHQILYLKMHSFAFLS